MLSREEREEFEQDFEVDAVLFREMNRLKPEKQIDGFHYEGKIEPIEFIEANDIPFHEANVIKYVFRHKKKNGIKDIDKAIWYLNRIKEIHYAKAD